MSHPQKNFLGQPLPEQLSVFPEVGSIIKGIGEIEVPSTSCLLNTLHLAEERTLEPFSIGNMVKQGVTSETTGSERHELL